MVLANRKETTMNEQPRQARLSDLSRTHLFHLGTHTLEVLEDQGILLMDTATGKEVVQLDEETAYLLTVALISLHQQQ
jgi:hypothetical protein